jgi:adenylate cyclase
LTGASRDNQTVAMEPGHRHRAFRSSIVARLIAAFLLVSLLPIGILAYLSARETGQPTAEHAEAEATGDEIMGIRIAHVEVGVAAASLLLAVGMAAFVGRSLVRPLRDLEEAMDRVERGDLEVRAHTNGSNDEIAHLARSFNSMIEGLERERLIRDLFGQYVSPEVAALAIERKGRLEGGLIEATVLFVDIRDFTSLTESLPPATLIRTLNRFLAAASAVVAGEGGMVNKFGGDSLLAVFGTPLNPAADHAGRAVRAALAILGAVERFNAEENTGVPELGVGVGIATGEIVAGNVGGEDKVEYTVIGDAVNLASRLQTLTRETGQLILVSDETARAAAGVASFVTVGDVTVRGKRDPVHACAVGESLTTLSS